MPAPTPVRVAVAIPTTHRYQRDVIAGAALSPSRRQGGWELVLASSWPADGTGRWPPDWRPQGVLAWTGSAAAHLRLAALGCPLVDLGNPDGPAVQVDLPAICRLAIDHLLSRGYRHAAVATLAGSPANRFDRAMVEEGRRRGLEMPAHPLPWQQEDTDPQAQVVDFSRWLAGLPRPLGLVCHSGGHARAVASACRLAGLAIPGDVGVIASDDEPLGTLMTHVPLSAVNKPNALMGERAAARLARLMAGQDPGPGEVLAPIGIIARSSTDPAAGDALVAAASAWILAHLAEPIGVDAVARAAGASRRVLERRFRAARCGSVLAEIQRVRLERAQQLAAQGEPVAAVAAQVGMSESSLYQRFRRSLGTSPAAWARGARRN